MNVCDVSKMSAQKSRYLMFCLTTAFSIYSISLTMSLWRSSTSLQCKRLDFRKWFVFVCGDLLSWLDSNMQSIKRVQTIILAKDLCSFSMYPQFKSFNVLISISLLWSYLKLCKLFAWTLSSSNHIKYLNLMEIP